MQGVTAGVSNNQRRLPFGERPRGTKGSTAMNFSRHLIKTAALACVTLASTTGLGFAGGVVDQGSSVRNAGTAVPVPVPEPVPNIPTGFYVRLDAAYSQGDVSKYKSTDPRVDSIRGDSYLDNYPRYGVGMGYYFNRWFRADITLDQRNNAISKGTGSVNYTIANAAGGVDGLGNPLPATIAMRDTYRDNFTSSNSTGLINGYVDMPVHQAFTPYIGAGIGFVRHQLKGRDFSRTVACVDTVDCDPNTPNAQALSTALNGSFSTTAGGVNYQLAAALMAGFTYQVWDNTKLDIGYRWLHLQGASWTGRSSTTVENLKLSDQNIHEVRAGLRWDIN